MTSARRCICGHAESKHAFDGDESICAEEGCQCARFHLWEAVIESPHLGRERFKVTCVEAFVRQHAELFLPEDAELRLVNRGRDGGASDFKTHWTRAGSGLRSIIERVCESWKGWTVVTFPKTYRST